MRINPFIYGFLVLAVFLGVIYGFQTAGAWSVSGKVDAEGKAIQPDAENVESIKGWMTMEQIVTAYNVSLEEIIQTFNLPAEVTPDTAVKDLESETFSVDSLREWLAGRSSREQTPPTEEPVLPTPTPAPTAAPTATVRAPVSEPAAAEEHVSEDFTVTAQTSFQDLLDWGVTQETIERILGGSMPPASMDVKDYVTGQGLKFSTVKAELQAEVDKMRNP